MKILLLILIILIPLIKADTDGTYYTAVLGNSTTYIGRTGNLNLGLFFEERMDLVEEIMERLEWFNTDLFRATSIGGAVAHLLLLFLIIGMIIISEVSQLPAFMILSSMAVFFFSWLVFLSISAIIGFVIMIFGVMYMIRSIIFSVT